jgi:predicted GNAT family acetyltransferase
VEVYRPASLTEFLELGGSFLTEHEAEHGLMLGVASSASTPAADAYWALVLHGGCVVAAGLRTGDKLIVSRENAGGAVAALARDALQPPLRSVLGPPASVAAFTAASARPWRLRMAQRIYENRIVVPATGVPGSRRLARPNDSDVLAEWSRRLSADALGEIVSKENALSRVEGHIARGSMHVWDVDGRPVCVAAAVAPTPHGIRLNNVYTPRELRGHGYASALVAGLTQAMLDAGREFVFLHTDLANLTSNGMYQRVGYRPVADLQMLNLDD